MLISEKRGCKTLYLMNVWDATTEFLQLTAATDLWYKSTPLAWYLEYDKKCDRNISATGNVIEIFLLLGLVLKL